MIGFAGKVWNSGTTFETEEKGTKKTSVEKNIANYLVIHSSKVWNSVTGRATFEQAETLLHEIERKYEESKEQYEKAISSIASQIEQKISKINYHKQDIYSDHFARFISLGNKLHNISVKGTNFLDYFDDSIIRVKELATVRNKSELYLIDFNNLKFTEIALGIITLGFFSRKKAKQTLSEVQKEEKKINKEIAKMKSQIVKAENILRSIENVAEYFTVLIQKYAKLLDRFEYGIKSQTQINILKGNVLENGKLDFKMMPVAHLEEFQALFNLSIVLKQMASLGYLNEEGQIEKNDIQSVETLQIEIKNTQVLAA